MHIPSSTYRIQLNQDFTLSDLRNIIPYLHELGISTIYAAPVVKATPGSMHGYDVTDPHRINPEVGSISKLREINELLLKYDMKWLQDIVPNHMAFNTHNQRLMDVLERGPASPYYHYFDINWNHQSPGLQNRVMVPFLGKTLAESLDMGEISLTFTEQGFTLNYYEDRYPVSYRAVEYLQGLLDPKHTWLVEMLTEFTEQLRVSAPRSEWNTFRSDWLGRIRERPEAVTALSDLCQSVTKDVMKLEAVTELQHYILTFWKVTEREINYRRFFTVNSLICLQMEREEVFMEYHQLIADLYKSGVIHGVRIDHIDGLNDPVAYLHRLRTLLGADCFIIAEKILEAEEQLPADWPLQGTSGYEFLAYVNKLLTDRHGSDALVKFYRSIAPRVADYEELVLKNKRLIIEKHMAGELENLVQYFFELKLNGAFQRSRIRLMLEVLMLSLPVYRIYPQELPLKNEDATLLAHAFDQALIHGELVAPELQYFRELCFGDQLTLPHDRILLFLKRMMQFTGPLTAKGVEDTTFYIYNPLISHDEVGDAPSALGEAIQSFHKRMITRRESNRFSLNATATHDTKRGEDARLRLNVISQMPEAWSTLVRSWMEMNMSLKLPVKGVPAPAVNDEYFIYQSVLGGFPEDQKVNVSWISRLKEYIIKVVREAKVESSWENPNEDYENACTAFIDGILKEDSGFLETITPFVKTVIESATTLTLAQTVVKITTPGIPDIYQGCELWDLSYVDPDNRRPVDFDLRKKMLDEITRAHTTGWEEIQKVLEKYSVEGSMKFFATMTCLNFRREKQQLFDEGAYVPLTIGGAGPLVAGFVRYAGERWCVVVVPLQPVEKIQNTDAEMTENFISLPAKSPLSWRNIFTQEVMTSETGNIAIRQLFNRFPVAVLYGEIDGSAKPDLNGYQ